MIDFEPASPQTHPTVESALVELAYRQAWFERRQDRIDAKVTGLAVLVSALVVAVLVLFLSGCRQDAPTDEPVSRAVDGQATPGCPCPERGQCQCVDVGDETEWHASTVTFSGYVKISQGCDVGDGWTRTGGGCTTGEIETCGEPTVETSHETGPQGWICEARSRCVGIARVTAVCSRCRAWACQ